MDTIYSAVPFDRRMANGLFPEVPEEEEDEEESEDEKKDDDNEEDEEGEGYSE
jgi:hypothetical protein